LSSIAGALLFITDQFGLTTRQQELLTTMVVIGQIAGALVGGALANAIGRKRSMATPHSRCWVPSRCRCRCCWRRDCCLA
jgi:MFS family permease